MLNISDIIEYKGGIVAAAFAALFVFEHLKPAAPVGKNPYKRIIKNLLFWPLNIGLSLTVILPISYAAMQMQIWTRPDWLGGVAGLALDIVLLDLFIFWWHRSVHIIPFFWRFHEVHHLDEHLDTTSAIRFHFGEVFFASFVRAVVIMTCVIPFSSVIIFEALILVFTLFHHSNIKLPKKFEWTLSKLIITPSIHWVHHHAIRRDTDSNYGTIFSFWDRIFRTSSITKRTSTMKIGVEGKKDQAFLKLLLKPFGFISG